MVVVRVQTQPCLQAVLHCMLLNNGVMEASELVRNSLRRHRPAVLHALEWLIHSTLGACDVDVPQALALLSGATDHGASGTGAGAGAGTGVGAAAGAASGIPVRSRTAAASDAELPQTLRSLRNAVAVVASAGKWCFLDVLSLVRYPCCHARTNAPLSSSRVVRDVRPIWSWLFRFRRLERRSARSWAFCLP